MKFQLVWTQYGKKLAIGIRNLSDDKSNIERIYNLFYNYGVADGNYHEMNENKFGYFLVEPEALYKAKNITTELGKKVNHLLKTDFIEERFLTE